MDFTESIKKVKQDSFVLASTKEEVRNGALSAIASALEANKEAIFAANAKDLAAGATAKETRLSASDIRFLKAMSLFTEQSFCRPQFMTLAEIIRSLNLFLL